MDSSENIKTEVFGCKKCGLYKERNIPVVGAGNWNTEVMFVGEAPGANEDRTGLPFCGAAGKILDDLLLKADIKRDEVYITNILKCRPAGNRNPKEEEVRACTLYLDRQIDIINPKVICCLGNFATAYIMGKFGLNNNVQGISRIHGKVFSCNSLFGFLSIIPFYHPAALIYNVNLKDTLSKDFIILKEILRKEKNKTNISRNEEKY